MKNLVVVFLVIASLHLTAALANPINSHVGANMPEHEKLHSVIKQGLVEYFKKNYSATDLDYQLLRDIPSQVGVSYPKLYAWVEVKGTSPGKLSGAVRLSLREKKYCVVTHFLSSQDIRKNPKSAFFVFPTGLLPKVFSKCGITVDIAKNTPTEEESDNYLIERGEAQRIMINGKSCIIPKL